MDNPWSGKWGILVYRIGDPQFQDRLFGFTMKHSEVVECDDPSECWLDEHNDPIIYDKYEYAKIYCDTVSDHFTKYISIQIP